jgi:hypothetical protein
MENIPGASTPFKYAFTSGIPDPAAAGAINAVIIDANRVRTKLDTENTRNAIPYLPPDFPNPSITYPKKLTITKLNQKQEQVSIFRKFLRKIEQLP